MNHCYSVILGGLSALIGIVIAEQIFFTNRHDATAMHCSVAVAMANDHNITVCANDFERCYIHRDTFVCITE